MRRQALNVFRMRLLGAEVVGVESGSKTLKDAINEALRDWVTNVADTHYLLGSVLGPHPYPMMVRDFQSVIGREARAQMLERCGRLPDYLVACVGGGSNAMGLFHAFLERRRRQDDRRRSRRPRHRARRTRGAISGGRRRARRRAAGHAQLRPAGRPRPDRADAFGFGRSGLRQRRPRTRATCTTAGAPNMFRPATARRSRRFNCWRRRKGSSPRWNRRTPSRT